MMQKIMFTCVLMLSGTLFAQDSGWVDLKGGQGSLMVMSTREDVNENNIPTCLFTVAMGSDFQIDAKTATAIRAIETVSYIDDACDLKVGDVLLSTANVLASSNRLDESATFYMVRLGMGYISEIIFPNYRP
jgi:hypothetical protein